VSDQNPARQGRIVHGAMSKTLPHNVTRSSKTQYADFHSGP
jgi:hypothetical protein